MSKAAELAALIGSQTALSNRNMVVNGSMNIAQRSVSETGLGGSSGYFTLDRFKATVTSSGRFTMAQTAITDLPGFANALHLDCTTADTSIAADENLVIQHKFEGQDLQRLQKGTSSAKPVTVSFYAKANAAFTFVVELYDLDNTRNITQKFITSTSWTRHTLTFPGDTSGAFDDDNAASMNLSFWLHAGTTFGGTGGTFVDNTWGTPTNANRTSGISSFFSSTDNDLKITGVQMELGEQATPFEHRSFADELARCQRYTYVPTKTLGLTGQSGGFLGRVVYPVTMRSAPALTLTASAGYDNSNAFGNSPEANEFTITNVNSGNGVSFSTAPTGMIITEQTKEECMIGFSGASTPNEEIQNPIYALKFGTGASMLLSAEL